MDGPGADSTATGGHVASGPSQRTAVVTGTSGSLGAAIAEALESAGHRVVRVDKVRSSAPDLSIECDLSSPSAVRELVAELVARFQPDILINNAGLNPQGPGGSTFRLEESTDESWAHTLAVNLTAPYLLMRGVIGGMRERGWGRIVNIASRAGRTFVPASNVEYSASKAGLIGLTRMVAGEYAPFGVTVNTLAPGRFTSQLADSQSPDILAASMAQLPVGRVGQPAEVGEAVRYLCSDAAGYITGATLDINGGAFMP
jgi:NAD(P)-dependent dehydrogenase (short-subunit alcohol dehydrogenase family)